MKTTVTIGSVGYQGKVSAASATCVGERTVVLKQKGNGVLSRVKSKANGNWKADLEELNENIKIPAKVYAEVKRRQAPAGPVCDLPRRRFQDGGNRRRLRQASLAQRRFSQGAAPDLEQRRRRPRAAPWSASAPLP